MALPDTFLDEIRARTALSALIGRTLKLSKAGREWKACCPFHGEKTPSFTVNDDKAFGHCFGCGWHGDAFRWLMDQAGLEFMDAVRQLAAEAGLELPAGSAEAEQQAARVETVRGALETAQGVFAAQLEQAGVVMEYLAGRGVGPAEIAAFGVGYARGGDGSLRGSGIGQAIGREAGLLVPRSDGDGLRESFWERVTIPIHDHRGQMVGFGARLWKSQVSTAPKFVNSPDGPLFDKGRMLFNLHRAGAPARPQAENRLIIVEGYFDVIALARAGIHAAVAPMGTALTDRQLERAWRVHRRPVVLFDGDAAGRKAARRAAETALPFAAPGHELGVAFMPSGKDPDDLVRALGPDAARRELEALIGEAKALHAFLFEIVRDEWLGVLDRGGADPGEAPELLAAIWQQLAQLAEGIADGETRAQYLGLWRARYDRELSALPQIAAEEALHAVVRADPDPETGKPVLRDGIAYAFPESESDSQARLIAIVQRVLIRRAERKLITEEIADALKMAEAVGFVKTEINTVVRDIESDIAHGSGVREEAEMVRVLYRRTLGLRGPMTEAMLPQVIDARARPASATLKRRATMNALIDASAVAV